MLMVRFAIEESFHEESDFALTSDAPGRKMVLCIGEKPNTMSAKFGVGISNNLYHS